MNIQAPLTPRPREPDTVCLIPGPCPCSWPCQIAIDTTARYDEIKATLAAAYRGETLDAQFPQVR